jgi:hypothetical protein
MATVAYKFTMLFNTSTSQGFSESWYWASSTPISGLSTTPFRNLAEIRDGLCATGVNLVGWRISDTSDPRKVYAERRAIPAGAGNPQDPTSTAILALAYGVDGIGRRQFWMRGVRDEWIARNIAQNRWETVGSFTTAFEAFRNEIVSNTNSWRLKTFERLVTSPTKQKVSVLRISGGGRPILEVPAVAGFADSDVLTVSGFKKPLSYLNGNYTDANWNKSSGPPATIELGNQTLSEPAKATYGIGAFVRKQEVAYTGISHIELGDPRSRRVGRAFFVPAGRR